MLALPVTAGTMNPAVDISEALGIRDLGDGIYSFNMDGAPLFGGNIPHPRRRRLTAGAAYRSFVVRLLARSVHHCPWGALRRISTETVVNLADAAGSPAVPKPLGQPCSSGSVASLRGGFAFALLRDALRPSTR